MRQDFTPVEAEHPCLVGAHLEDVDLVVAGVSVGLDGRQVPLGVGPAGDPLAAATDQPPGRPGADVALAGSGRQSDRLGPKADSRTGGGKSGSIHSRAFSTM